jgi:hypothetical protein
MAISKNQKIASAGEEVEKLGLLQNTGGNLKWHSCGKQFKIKVPHDSATSLVAKNPQDVTEVASCILCSLEHYSQ